MWQQSEQDTRELRAAVDCPLDACVYRNGDLMALVYCQPGGADERARWHLYVASHVRMPEMSEVLDARQELLPNISNYVVTPEPTMHNGVHVCELPGGNGKLRRLS
jgi:hypothetical protein